MNDTESAWEDLRRLTNPYILQFFDVKCDDLSSIYSIPADQLLTPLRFDIYAKHIYARFWSKKLQSTWGTTVYLDHIKAFNGYEEGDGSGKSGPNAFISSFDQTLTSIRMGGFDSGKSIVPISRSRIVVDGSHRVAAAIFFKKDVTVAELKIPDCVFDYQFFGKNGMSAQCMDSVALEFCSLDKSPYVSLLFPAAVGKYERVLKVLEKCGRIFYEKSIVLSRRGVFNLVRQIYENEPWVGDWRNGFQGALYKANACFAPNSPLRIIVHSGESLDSIRGAKEEIRRLFGIGNHSIHINDTRHEAIGVAQLILNDNSVHFLNHAEAPPYRKFNQYFRSFRRWMTAHEIPNEQVCVDGSAVLGAYGIREPSDFDFIHHGDDVMTTGLRNITSHNEELHHHIYSKDDLIHNPRNHFYFYGIKFVSLQALKAMKLKRGELKDLQDAELITRYCNSSKSVGVSFHCGIDVTWRRVKDLTVKKAFCLINLTVRVVRRLKRLWA